LTPPTIAAIAPGRRQSKARIHWNRVTTKAEHIKKEMKELYKREIEITPGRRARRSASARLVLFEAWGVGYHPMHPVIDRYSQYWAGPESTVLKPVLGSFWNVPSGFFSGSTDSLFSVFFYLWWFIVVFLVLKRFFLFFVFSF
jgi:hypothetical protein